MRHATALPILDARGIRPRHEIAAMTYLAGFNGATHANYTSLLRTFFAWCAQVDLDPLDATRAHLELYVRYCENELRNHPSTIRHKVGVLRGYYDFANYDGMIPTNPAARVRSPQFFHDETRIVGLDRVEMTRLITTAQASTPDDEALIVLMGMLGLRVGEAIKVRIEDFGDAERSHTVLRVLGKGHKAATIPLPAPVLRSLLRARGDRHSGVLILRATNGEPHSAKSARRAVARLTTRAGINKHVKPHTLRHSFVTGALDAGVPLRLVQVGARHSDPRTTTRYDRSRLNLDQHPAYVVAGYFTGGA